MFVISFIFRGWNLWPIEMKVEFQSCIPVPEIDSLQSKTTWSALFVLFISGVSHKKYLGCQVLLNLGIHTHRAINPGHALRLPEDLTWAMLGAVTPPDPWLLHPAGLLLPFGQFLSEAVDWSSAVASSASLLVSPLLCWHSHTCPNFHDMSVYLWELLKSVHILSFGFDFCLPQKFYITLTTLLLSKMEGTENPRLGITGD